MGKGVWSSWGGEGKSPKQGGQGFCVKCQRDLPSHYTWCARCGQSLDQQARAANLGRSWPGSWQKPARTWAKGGKSFAEVASAGAAGKDGSASKADWSADPAALALDALLASLPEALRLQLQAHQAEVSEAKERTPVQLASDLHNTSRKLEKAQARLVGQKRAFEELRDQIQLSVDRVEGLVDKTRELEACIAEASADGPGGRVLPREPVDAGPARDLQPGAWEEIAKLVEQAGRKELLVPTPLPQVAEPVSGEAAGSPEVAAAGAADPSLAQPPADADADVLMDSQRASAGKRAVEETTPNADLVVEACKRVARQKLDQKKQSAQATGAAAANTSGG
jgi:hypothetical protein